MSTMLPNLPRFAMRVLSRFTHLLDRQTQKGIATYGMTLDQNADFDKLNGALEEIVDAAQYIVRAVEERDERDAVVREVIADLEAYDFESFTHTERQTLYGAIQKLRGTLTPEKREGAGECKTDSIT